MTKAVATSRDPVCGTVIEVARSSRFITYRGMLYHFCSAHCHERFSDIPALYTGSQRIADILPIPKRRKLRLANGNESDIQRAAQHVGEMIGVTSVATEKTHLLVEYDLRKTSSPKSKRWPPPRAWGLKMGSMASDDAFGN